jgi:hypothetical protein
MDSCTRQTNGNARVSEPMQRRVTTVFSIGEPMAARWPQVRRIYAGARRIGHEVPVAIDPAFARSRIREASGSPTRAVHRTVSWLRRCEPERARVVAHSRIASQYDHELRRGTENLSGREMNPVQRPDRLHGEGTSGREARARNCKPPPSASQPSLQPLRINNLHAYGLVRFVYPVAQIVAPAVKRDYEPAIVPFRASLAHPHTTQNRAIARNSRSISKT